MQDRRCLKHWGIDNPPLTSYLREYIGNLAEKAQRSSDFGNMKIDKAAITSLKNEKATRPDLITAKMLKVDIDLYTRTLTNLFDKIWRQEKIPMDWSKGVIISTQIYMEVYNISGGKNYNFIYL